MSGAAAFIFLPSAVENHPDVVGVKVCPNVWFHTEKWSWFRPPERFQNQGGRSDNPEDKGLTGSPWDSESQVSVNHQDTGRTLVDSSCPSRVNDLQHSDVWTWRCFSTDVHQRRGLDLPPHQGMRQVLDAEPFSGLQNFCLFSLTFDPGCCRFCPALWILQLHP